MVCNLRQNSVPDKIQSKKKSENFFFQRKFFSDKILSAKKISLGKTFWLGKKFLLGKKCYQEKIFLEKKFSDKRLKVQESDEIDQNLANKVTN